MKQRAQTVAVGLALILSTYAAIIASYTAFVGAREQSKANKELAIAIRENTAILRSK